MSPQVSKPIVAAVTAVCYGDCCVSAVKRAFREMKEQGQPDKFAIDAAFRVFRWHHPEIDALQAENIVAHWVHDGAVH